MDEINEIDLTKPEGKKIAELVNLYGEVASAFIGLHKNTIDHNELFIILRESCLAFAGSYLKWLCKAIESKEQKMNFLEVSKKIFNMYMQEMLEDIEKNGNP